MLFLNGTNDFAYPLDSYRKTIEQVRPELATVSIQVRLPHGHIWRFGVVDAFIDSHVRAGAPLAQLGELRVIDGQATAPIVNDVRDIKEVKLLYSHDVGEWPKRKWETRAGKFDKESGRLSATIPAKRPIAFILQATDGRGNPTSTTHFHLHANVDESNPSLIPTPRLERDFYDWRRRHADALWVKREIDPQVVLIGDSITHMWAGRPVERKFHRGADSWKSTFGDKALNLGFGWDRTQNVLWRIEHGELDGINPKTVIVHIGTNNLAGTPRHRTSKPAEVAAAIGEICRRVRERVPRAKLVVMAVFPRGEKPDHPKRDEIAEINKLLPPIVKEHGATLVDMTSDFLEADGTISRDVMGDFLHPAAKGYQIWARRVAPLLAK
jgi:lysophospholipase L1-like esterase